MQVQPKRIQIEQNLTLAYLLTAAQNNPVVFKGNGIFFRLQKEQTIGKKLYDTKQLKKALQSTAGIFAGINKDELLRDIHSARTQKA